MTILNKNEDIIEFGNKIRVKGLGQEWAIFFVIGLFKKIWGLFGPHFQKSGLIIFITTNLAPNTEKGTPQAALCSPIRLGGDKGTIESDFNKTMILNRGPICVLSRCDNHENLLKEANSIRKQKHSFN